MITYEYIASGIPEGTSTYEIDMMTYEYIVAGTLPQGTSTYVKRKADDELFANLYAGQFCYVFEPSKAGKSSSPIQVKSRLEEVGFACSMIDLQGKSTESQHSEKFYDGICHDLVKDLKLEVNFSSWIEENHWLSPLDRFRKFIESVMLAQIPKTIIIFFDEVNHLTNFNFSTDDFFGLIRFCYNQRANNTNYNRLVFCLSGIASPSNLVKNKQITPFNISKAISLEPFKLADVEPLQRGLEGKFDNTEAVMKEILYWTGGQPFLTQKLCKLMLKESEKDHPRSVKEVVRENIIEKWTKHDTPAYLQTIRNRIVESRKASDLLELYQKIIRIGEIESNDSSEVTELLLSGIVVKVDGKLKVYNPIYQEIFNLKWIENQLNILRPYSENYHAWLDSGNRDKSRLLRGNALQHALKWASVRNLSFEEREYLELSREQERQEKQAAKDQEAELKRERKSREAAEKSNRRIRFGSVFLAVALLGSITVLVLSQKQSEKIANEVKSVQQLTAEAGELQIQDNVGYTEALRLSALSFSIDSPQLKQALLSATASQVEQKLATALQVEQKLATAQAEQKLQKLKEVEKIKEAEKKINTAQEILSNLSESDKKSLDSSQGLQVQILFYISKGSLLAQKNQTQKAIESYQAAYNIWKTHTDESYLNQTNKLVIPENVEFIHLALLKLISENNKEKELKKQLEESLKNYLYTQLEYYLKTQKWLAADEATFKLMLIIDKRDKDGYLDGLDRDVALDSDFIKNLSCPDLQKIDNLWVKYSDGHFGYSVQGKIFLETGNKLNQGNESDYNKLAYKRFGKLIGWYDEKRDKQRNGGGWLNRRHQELTYSINAPKGHLPGNGSFWLWSDTVGLYYAWEYSARTAACTLPKD